MTKLNNEWVPETFDEVEVWIDNVGYWAKVKVLALDCGRVVWRNGPDGLSYIGTPLEFVRPIKTEAEKRRENMIEEAHSLLEQSCLTYTQAEILIDANWIKPKPLTDDVITDLFAKEFSPTNKCGITFAKAIEAYIRGEG